MANYKKDTIKQVKRRRGMMAILTSVNLTDAAAKAEIPYDTLYRWTQEISFMRELAAYQEQCLQTACGNLVSGMTSAAKALIQIVQSPMSSEMGKIAAARSILDYGDRLFVARSLERRMKVLEAGDIEADNELHDITQTVGIARAAAQNESVRGFASMDQQPTFEFEEQPTTDVLPRGCDSAGQQVTCDSEGNDSLQTNKKQAVWSCSALPVKSEETIQVLPPFLMNK